MTIAAGIILWAGYKTRQRLQLSRAKHPSLRGHVKWSRRIARQIPYFEFSEADFFDSDGAPQEIKQQRIDAFNKLRQTLEQQTGKTIASFEALKHSISDVDFTNAYRVPFPYRKVVNKYLSLAPMVIESNGVKLKDLDGNWRIDVSGSYGVNLFGYDFYKSCMQQGLQKVARLGPVLGPYHPLIADNVARIKKISGLDEVSFHMSGTEAVMQAVRLARYHTGKTHLVRLCGAYHGWWDGVQPGIGNQRQTDDVYTLSDLSENTLKVLKTRDDIACVLINPFQALHPNADASSDAALINSARDTRFERQRYTQWLQQIREVCRKRSIVLIFDEVFSGFRLGYRGAQEYFGIQADMVTYGKTIGGGLPIGVVCGSHRLMKRYREDRPVDISFARGTFNSHPYVMACMNEFLKRIESTEIQNQYQHADKLWDDRVARFNREIDAAGLPLRIDNMLSVFTIIYTRPSRYNWMLQYYLSTEQIALSWIGTGRMIISHDFSDDDFAELVKRFITAAQKMQQDGWWWSSPALTNQSIKSAMLKAMLAQRFPILARFLKTPAFQARSNLSTGIKKA